MLPDILLIAGHAVIQNIGQELMQSRMIPDLKTIYKAKKDIESREDVTPTLPP